MKNLYAKINNIINTTKRKEPQSIERALFQIMTPKNV